MEQREPSFLQGLFLCIWDSEAVRLQTSQWKRSLLVFVSGICIEISVVPYLAAWMGYLVTRPVWFVTALFLPLAIVGFYASKFGSDRLVEWLLIMPSPDRKLRL
jgi:hypothetical protein